MKKEQVILNQNDKVVLLTGEKAVIVEVYENGLAYEADIEDKDDGYRTDTIFPKDIKSIVIEVEKPYSEAV